MGRDRERIGTKRENGKRERRGTKREKGKR